MEAGRPDLVQRLAEGSPEDQKAERRSSLDKEVGWGKGVISRGNSMCKSLEVGGSMAPEDGRDG